MARAADELEPEEGIFAGYTPPEPYELVLRRALLEGDHYRLCQLVIVPSFSQERAVYIVRAENGSAKVISRTLREQVWPAMLKQMEAAAKSKSIALDSESESIALAKIRMAVDTHTRALDGGTADLVAGVCRDVLLRTRYPEAQTAGLDGTVYHAGHWIAGAFLAGHTWSPKEGTIPGDFVAMELALKAYADAPETGQAAKKVDLIAKARALADRLNVATPANEASQSGGASRRR